MLSARPPIRSFGRLATQLLGDPGWPAEQQVQARSLAAVLSKLDRDVDLGWLADRTDVQVLLARALGCGVEVVAAHAAGAGPDVSGRQIRWNDLRFARPFDLLEEALPPGIPDEVCDPAGWSRTWWVVPRGGGRSLAGRWLEARALARHFRTDSELRDALESAVPLFVELDSPDLESTLRDRSRVCVAAPHPPTDASAWNVVRSPAAEQLLGPVVRWVADRLPSDSDFDVEMALTWLRDGPLSSGELESLGAIMGIAGALDELGMRETRNRNLIDVAAHHVRRRFAETLGDAKNDVAWVRRNAVDLLVGMARRALTDDDQPWTSARSMDAWLALVPEQHRVGVEVEWLRLSLSRVDTSIRAADIERAARQMSPGAFRIVRTFREVGLLVETTPGRLALRPQWLATAVLGAARRNLLEGSPFEWGEALLSRHSAPEVARVLLDRLSSGDSTPLSDVVELEAEDSPAYVAALETTFRAAGVALLGSPDMDPELLNAVWEEQWDLMLETPGSPPCPRIEHAGSQAALLSRGAWYLAALAISERSEGQTKDGVLSPWRLDAVPAGLDVVVEAACDAARRARRAGEQWGFEAHALVDRLRMALGSSIASPPRALPGTLLDEAAQGVLSWDSLQAFPEPDTDVVLWLAEARGTAATSTFARACWRAWRDAGSPEILGTVLDPRARRAASMWSALPAELVPVVVERLGDDLAAVLAALGDEQWATLLDAPALFALPRLSLAVARVVSAERAAHWVQGRVHEEALRELWSRHSEVLARALADWAKGEAAPSAMAILRHAPTESVSVVLEALSDEGDTLPRLDSQERRALVHALHEIVAERRPAWRAAYDVMSRLLR